MTILLTILGVLGVLLITNFLLLCFSCNDATEPEVLKEEE